MYLAVYHNTLTDEHGVPVDDGIGCQGDGISDALIPTLPPIVISPARNRVCPAAVPVKSIAAANAPTSF